MPVDTTKTIEISGSPTKLLLLVGVGILMTGVSAAVAFDLIPDDGRTSSFTRAICYFGVAFFGLCTLVALWRLFTSAGGPVLTISPEGIRDTRVARDFIPWRAVQKISTWAYSGQQVMVVAIDPAFENSLTLTTIARWSRGPNRALGADGLAITAQGLNIDHETLITTSIDYAAAHRAR